MLRTLDAIHLATAYLIEVNGQPIDAFVGYDSRLLDAATSIGLAVASPGRPDHPAPRKVTPRSGQGHGGLGGGDQG